MDTGLYIGPDGAPDRYRLLRSIGRGGEAVLYLAEIELGGGTEPVVVKVLDSKTTLSQEQFDRISSKWREQAELLRFVNRLGVVGIREHFEGASAHRTGEAAPEAGRALYLVMNHVEGLDLRDWRAERVLDTPAERREAVRCLEQLADVLDWLHTGSATPSGRSVVHGDLSPGNVMIDANGQATLVDFGLSKLTADHQTAEVWFTPGFAAPEVFEGKRSAATDRYAFGALAYFLLSGESPATMPEQVRAALLALPELAGLEPERAARIASVFATEPANRPESLTAWVRELRPAVISTTRTPRTSGPKDAVPVADATPPPPAHAPAVVVPPLPDRPAPTGAPTAAPTAAPVHTPVPVPVHAPPVHTPPPSYIPAPPAEEPVTDTRPTVVLGAQPPVTAQPAAAFHEQPPPPSSPGPATAATPVPVPPAKRGKKGPVILAAVLAVVLMGAGALVAVKFMGDDTKDGNAADGKNSTASQHQSSSPPTTTDPTSASPSDSASSPEPSGSDSGSGKPTSITEGDNVSLTAMNWVDASGNDAFDEVPATVNTKEYTDAKVTTACSTGFEEFNLNRAWTTFTVDAGLLDTSKNAAVGLTITADGKRLALKKLVLGTTEKITVDVKGALRLRIEYDRKTAAEYCEDQGTAALGNPTLKK